MSSVIVASSKVSQRNGYKTLNYMNSLPNRTGPSIQRGVSQNYNKQNNSLVLTTYLEQQQVERNGESGLIKEKQNKKGKRANSNLTTQSPWHVMEDVE